MQVISGLETALLRTVTLLYVKQNVN